jgi:hypothetical protein
VATNARKIDEMSPRGGGYETMPGKPISTIVWEKGCRLGVHSHDARGTRQTAWAAGTRCAGAKGRGHGVVDCCHGPYVKVRGTCRHHQSQVAEELGKPCTCDMQASSRTDAPPAAGIMQSFSKRIEAVRFRGQGASEIWA